MDFRVGGIGFSVSGIIGLAVAFSVSCELGLSVCAWRICLAAFVLDLLCRCLLCVLLVMCCALSFWLCGLVSFCSLVWCWLVEVSLACFSVGLCFSCSIYGFNFSLNYNSSAVATTTLESTDHGTFDGHSHSLIRPPGHSALTVTMLEEEF